MINLHSIVRRLADENPEVANPGDLADLVFASLDPGDYADAVRAMLRQYVRTIMNESRRAPAVLFQAPVLETVPPQPRSRKVTGIRESWRARLAERYCGANGWKLLRDCTQDDVAAIVAERTELAKANAMEAQRFEKIAALLREHGAAVVGDLPDAVLADVLAD